MHPCLSTDSGWVLISSCIFRKHKLMAANIRRLLCITWFYRQVGNKRRTEKRKKNKRAKNKKKEKGKNEVHIKSCNTRQKKKKSIFEIKALDNKTVESVMSRSVKANWTVQCTTKTISSLVMLAFEIALSLFLLWVAWYFRPFFFPSNPIFSLSNELEVELIIL